MTLKRKTVAVKLADNVTYPMADKVCVHCRREFSINAFVRRLVCGACSN